MATQPIATKKVTSDAVKPAKALLLENATNEVVFAVVGYVGSGTSEIATKLRGLLENTALPGGKFDVEILKARKVIEDWATRNGETPPSTPQNDLATTRAFQDLGDKMRSGGDHALVARDLIGLIRLTRASKLGITNPGEDPVQPDGVRRAYILDSIRHPAEVELLRRVYQEAFVLVGIVCEAKVRQQRIVNKYTNAGVGDAEKFMARDSRAVEKYGQRVSDAFHMADFFVDNTVEQFVDGEPNEDWDISDKLSRLIKIMTAAEVVRPTIAETAMHDAFGAAMQSACLSRQVGAALLDQAGNVVATGTNEVPRAGGGVTDDDVVILRLLARHRFLRSTHIAALVDRSLDRTNDRLLRLFHSGHVDRPRAQLDYYPTSGSGPIVYALDDLGARLLTERDGTALANSEWSRKNREVGRPFIEHQLEVVDFQVALELVFRHRTDVRLIHSDELIAAFPEQTRIMRNPLLMRVCVSHNGDGQEIGLIPDLIFGIAFPDGSRRCFMVEIDRGTMPISRSDLRQTSIERKMRAYLTAHANKQHESQFGWKAFRVLAVTTDHQRMRSMIEVLRQLHTPQSPGASLFFFAIRAELRASDPLAHAWREENGRQMRLV